MHTESRRPRWRGFLAVLCGAAGLAGPTAVCHAQGTGNVTTGADSGGNFLADDAQDRINEIVRNAVSRGKGEAQNILADRKVTPLTYSDAMQQGLRRNLSVRLQKQISVETEAAALGTRAAFDPVTSVVPSFSRNTTYARADTITRIRQPVPDFATFEEQFKRQLQSGGGQLAPPTTATCSVSVDGQPVLNSTGTNPNCTPVTTTQIESASFASLNPDMTLSVAVNGGKLLDYGGFFSLSLRSLYNPRPSPFVGLSQTDFAYVDRNWAYTTALAASFATPLPFGKNYGPYGTAQATNLRLAESRVERARYERGAVENITLVAVDNAYWDLVGSVMALQVTLNQKALLEQLRQRAQSSYKLRESNEYSMNQIEAKLASVLSRESLAWNALVVASESLSNLLNGDVDELLLPVDYKKFFEQVTNVDLDTALKSALARNDEIRRNQLLLEESRITLNHALNNTKPDLLLNASVSLGQNNEVVGFRTIGNSLQNIFNPDTRVVSFGVTIRVPIGNAAAKAAASQARVGEWQARDQLTLAQNQVVQQLTAALDALQSAEKQIEVSRLNVDLAGEAYDAGRRRRALNLVTEFELIELQSDLLAARLAHVNALVQYRKNVAQFLASQNLLAASLNE